MTLVWMNGWEVGQEEGEPLANEAGQMSALIGSGMSIENTIVRSGNHSLKAAAVSGVSGSGQSGGVASANYRSIHVRITALPVSTARVLIGSTLSVSIRLNPIGTLSYFNGVTLIGTSTTALTDSSRWYRIGFARMDGTNIPLLTIDGKTEVSGSPSAWQLVQNIGPNDTVADTYTAYFDDFAEDNAQFPGDNKTILLLPISDNARDTLWTGGVGGTSNLWDAVNNHPPQGTASETDTTQIEHAGGAAGTTDRYDANMASYTSAGIVDGDTINGLIPFVIHGEDVSTGTKNLSFQVLSNPTTTSSGSFVAGYDVGALGTYSSNWRTHNTAIVTSPSVTLSTSPVMRVVRPETATRVASICFMGIYVNYTPTMKIPQVRKNRRWVSGMRNR